jgi:hypothetical protein
MKRETTPPDVVSYSLDEFFTKTYVVPAYQRNYTWTEKEIRELLTDLLEFFDNPREPYYLLGDVIVVETDSADYDFEIIDGQQRITTLILIFSTIYVRLLSLSFDRDELNDIRSVVKKKKLLRVKMSGGASELVLSFVNGVATRDLPRDTPSQKTVVEALDTIDAVLGETFSERKPGYLHDFYTTLYERVFLSRLRLLDPEAAYDFFERVNDRGRPLSKTDLLKNRLLQKIKSYDDFENASDVWAAAEKLLLPYGREGSMPYLLRAMLNADLSKKVKDNDLFREWKPFVQDDGACLKLVDRIEQKSKHLAQVLAGNTLNGTQDIHSAGTSFMKFTQNYSAKLAAAGLNGPTYDTLTRRLEARALLSLFSLERSQTYEFEVVKWAHRLQKLGPSAGTDDLLNAIPISAHEIEALLERAKLSAQALRYGKTPGQTNRIRLLLAIANSELLARQPKQHVTLVDYLQTSKKVRGREHAGYDIEHVGAASTARERLGEQVDSVGNLTLFYSKDNRSHGASDVEHKASDYGNSICYATKILTARADPDPTLELVLGPFRQTTVDDGEWNLVKVEQRFEMYWSLFDSRIRTSLIPTPD